MKLWIANVLLVIAAACTPAPVAPSEPNPPPAAEPAEPTAAEPAAPTAESIIEASIEASGGRAARERITAMRSTGKMQIAKLGISGKVTAMNQAPNLALLVVDIDGLGRTENGCDGKTVWEKSAMTGSRVLAGTERERMLRKFTLNPDLKWREMYKKAELVGEVEFEGRPAWKIQFTTPLDDIETVYYDRETRLPLGSEEVAKTQMGDMPTKSVIRAWRDDGGIKTASQMVEITAGMQIEVTLDTVELNPTLPPETFAVPKDVIPLMK
jgi:hypothetical protein